MISTNTLNGPLISLVGGEGTLSQAIIISRTHPAWPRWLATLWKGLDGL